MNKQILDNFEKRVSKEIEETITQQDRDELDGAYLSTYECYSESTQDYPNDSRKCNSAIVLMRIFRKMGINILGVTSERTFNGKYVAANRENLEKIVYVGKHSYFTNKKSYKWRLMAIDKTPPPL